MVYFTLHKKWSFSLQIFSVNVTKYAMENFIFSAVGSFYGYELPVLSIALWSKNASELKA